MPIDAERSGSITGFRGQLKKSGGSFGVQNVPENGSLTVRFLTEPDDFVRFREYFSEEHNAFIPMERGEDVPDGAKPSTRWLASVVVLDAVNANTDLSDKVVALKLTKGTAEDLNLFYDKYGETLMDRPYEISRAGTGFDTRYRTLPEAPAKFAHAKYKPLDLIQILADARDRALDPAVTEAMSDKPGKRAKPAKSSEPTTEDLGKLADGGDDDAMATLGELAEAAGLDPDDFGTWVELAEALEPEPEPEAEEEPEEAEADEPDVATLVEQADEGDDDAVAALWEWQSESAPDIDPDQYATWAEWYEAVTEAGEDEQMEVSEEILASMSLADLRKVADEFGIEHKGLNVKSLRQSILDAAESGDE